MPPPYGVDAAPSLAGGRYRLVTLLGEGGQASVYRAWDERLRVWRAIKVLHPHSRRSLRERFEIEARTLARLKHPNLLVIHDVADDGDRSYMVMALAAESLDQRLHREGPLPPGAACRLFERLADALSVAHGGGIVHRDLKPSNILADSTGDPLIADFGIARVHDDRRTRTGGVLGTERFMAPEQSADSASVDPRADLYSLGATLYAALTGREPAGPIAELPDTALATIPDPLRSLLRRATARDPAARHPTAEALRADLASAALAFLPTSRDRWQPPATSSDPPPSNAETAVPMFTSSATVVVPPLPRRGWRVTAPLILGIVGLLAMAVAGIAAAGLGLAGAWWLSREPPFEPIVLRRLTTYPPEIDLELGGLTDDGSELVYAEQGAGVWRQPVSGTAPPTLLAGPLGESDALLGAHGLARGAPDGSIAIRDPAGGEPWTFEHEHSAMYLSPSGARVAWLSPDATAVFRSPRGGSAVAVYKAAEGRTIDGLAWSPTEDRLALAIRDGMQHHVVVVDSQGTSSSLVYESQGIDGQLGVVALAWPWPDALIAAEGRPHGGDRLLVLPIAGGPPTTLADFDGHVCELSARSGTLAVLGVAERHDTWLATVRPGGALTDVRIAWQNEDADEPIGWWPDGTLLYGSDRFRAQRLLAERPGDPSAAVVATCPWLQPVGVGLAWFDGSEVRHLARPGFGDPPNECPTSTMSHLACSPDGSCVVATNLGDATEFARYGPRDPDVPSKLSLPIAEDLQAAPSPDGAAIAVTETAGDEGSASTIHVGTFATRTWGDVRVDGIAVQRVAWRTDAPGLWVTGLRPDGWVVAALRPDGSPQVVTPIPQGWPSQPTPSPDGATLAFSLVRFDPDVWVGPLPARAPVSR